MVWKARSLKNLFRTSSCYVLVLPGCVFFLPNVPFSKIFQMTDKNAKSKKLRNLCTNRLFDKLRLQFFILNIIPDHNEHQQVRVNIS